MLAFLVLGSHAHSPDADLERRLDLERRRSNFRPHLMTASEFAPALHGEHVPRPPVGAKVPAAHGVCSVLPVGAKWPGAVGVQSPALVRLVEVEYEPSAQGSAAAAPSGQ